MFSKLKEHVRRSNPLDEQNLMDLIENGCILITSYNNEVYFRKMLVYLPRSLKNEEIFD
jgi:hypothetical protein